MFKSNYMWNIFQSNIHCIFSGKFLLNVICTGINMYKMYMEFISNFNKFNFMCGLQIQWITCKSDIYLILHVEYNRLFQAWQVNNHRYYIISICITIISDSQFTN